MALQLKKPSVLPGFGLTMGFTLLYLSLLVLIPIGGAGAAKLDAWAGRDSSLRQRSRRSWPPIS